MVLTRTDEIVRTIVLVGRTGNGKSATGNSILGKKVFRSIRSPFGVTSTCELQTTIMNDGKVINVIDTPGLFDFSVTKDIICKEIVNCVGLSKDGIHAIIVVFSVRNRFSTEEEAALRSLQSFFGKKITDYMVIVFTGGDDFDDDDIFEEYLIRDFPDTFQEILRLCRNRVVLFDNKTKDETKRLQQVQQLLSLVDIVIAVNGGNPFSDQLLEQAKELDQQHEVGSLEGNSKDESLELKEHINKSSEVQYQRITEMVDSKFRKTIKGLEQQLAKEQAARVKANCEIRQLRETLREILIEKLVDADKGKCVIL